MLLIESILVIAAVFGALAFPSCGARWFEKLERSFSKLASRRLLSVTTVGLLALVFRAALLPVLSIPEPIVHDEFGYLLAADTFAHGRLTNPTHPMWVHFETFAVIQKPTYQCYAQPLQGMILAAGNIVAGHPFWGVWFSSGVMCAVLCWMLQGWLSPSWALLGGLLSILHFGTFGYWANSYWGGAAGAIGGALVLGALPRIKRSPRVLYAVVMALGLAILANSRPYEGFIFSLPVVIVILVWMSSRRGPQLLVSLRNIVIPACLVLTATAAAMGYYNYRVTGNPLRLPYQVEIETYAVAPYMIWQRPRPAPQFHHEVIRKLYADEVLQSYQSARSIVGPLLKFVKIWIFYLGPALTLPLLAVPFVLPPNFGWRDLDWKAQFLLFSLAISVLSLVLEVFFHPHYAAPITGLILIFVLLCLRRLRKWTWGERAIGLSLARSVVLICIIMFVLRIFADPLHIPMSESYAPAWSQRSPSSFGRAAIMRELQQLPGKQLVIVRYSSSHQAFFEWVYNGAAIDNSKVVWAHDMGALQNREILSYFSDREVFLLEPDHQPVRLQKYPNASDTSAVLRNDPPDRGELDGHADK